MFDAYSVLDRDTKNLHDWTNYKDYLGFEIHPNFKLGQTESFHNNNFIVNKLYDKQFNSEKNKDLRDTNKNISIVYIDVNYFRSVNVNDDKSVVKNEVNKLIKFMDADIYFITKTNDTNFPHLESYESIESENNIFYYRNRNIKNKAKIYHMNIKNIKSHHHKIPMFDRFIRIAEKNYDYNIQQFEKIIKEDPNIIFLNVDLTYSSPEFDYFLENGYDIAKIQTSVRKNNITYVLIKNDFKIKKIDTLDYKMNINYPIIIIL